MRRVAAGLVDQVVIASANAANTVLALALLDRTRAGTFVLCLGLAYLVLGVNRAFVGDVLLALASRYDGEQRDRLVRNGLAAALASGTVAAGVLLAGWALWPRHEVDLRDLVWVAPFLPALLVHDTARYSYLADRRADRALVIDLVWVGTQAACVLGLWTTGALGGGGLFVAWGLGATAGAGVFCARTGFRPWRGDPRAWIAQTRSLSGWFMATAVVGQFHVQAVAFTVAGQLGRAAVSGLRGAQTVVMQPVQNFSLAVLGLLVPRASRLAAAAAAPDPDGVAAVAALRRQIRLLALAFGGLAVLLVLVVWPLATTVLRRVPKFADVAPLALPVSLQAGVYLVQTPFQAALRGMHRARLLFAQYVAFAGTSLTALLVGGAAGGLHGAAWGLLAGAIVGLVVMVCLYMYAVRLLRGFARFPRPRYVRRRVGSPVGDRPPAPEEADEGGR